MVTKHFFKILFIFTLMIALGLAGVFILSNLDDASTKVNDPDTAI